MDDSIALSSDVYALELTASILSSINRMKRKHSLRRNQGTKRFEEGASCRKNCGRRKQHGGKWRRQPAEPYVEHLLIFDLRRVRNWSNANGENRHTAAAR